MKKLSALIVIVALLCSGTAFATWDWDVTCRVSTHTNEASIPDGYWFYEYAWEVIENTSGAFGDPSTPNLAWITVGDAPGILFNSSGFDSEAPDSNDWPTAPGTSALGTYSQSWLTGLGWTAYTGGYFLNTPGSIADSTPYGRVVYWDNFTVVKSNGNDPGLAFYTSFLAPRPPMTRPWGIDNAEMDGGTVCAPTPEPVSAVLLLLGLPAAAALRKRRE